MLGTQLAAVSLVSAQPGQTETAQGAASATVIEALRVVQEQDLSFGAVAASATSNGRVVVGPAGHAVSYSGGAGAACPASMADSCHAHPARFAVTGEAQRRYAIVVPAEVRVLGQHSGASLLVTDLAARSHNQPGISQGGVLDHDGKDTFTIGGTLMVPAGTESDVFRADLPVSAHYN